MFKTLSSRTIHDTVSMASKIDIYWEVIVLRSIQNKCRLKLQVIVLNQLVDYISKRNLKHVIKTGILIIQQKVCTMVSSGSENKRVRSKGIFPTIKCEFMIWVIVPVCCCNSSAEGCVGPPAEAGGPIGLESGGRVTKWRA